MIASYGDVTGEYLALRRGAALVEGTHEIVWVRGPDTVSFLDGLLSQAIEPMGPGTVERSLLLAPQGKLRATLLMLGDEGGIGLIADRGVGEGVIGDLRRFKIRVDAEIEPEPQRLDSVIGPDASAALEGIGAVAPEAGRWVGSADAAVVSAPFAGSGMERFLVSPSVGASLVDGGIDRAGHDAATAVRIESGEPVMGVDIDESTIPQEADVVEGAVSFTKGCYLGQELVARIDSRGHVNRHLRGLVLAENVLPPTGAEAIAADKPVGTLTSIAESLDLRAPIALALIRREVEPGDTVTIRWDGGETTAVVHSLPLLR